MAEGSTLFKEVPIEAEAVKAAPLETTPRRNLWRAIGSKLAFWNWSVGGRTKNAKAPKVVREGPRTIGRAALDFIQVWNWEVKPKGPPKPKKWWAVWRYAFWNAPPPTFKRSPIPSLKGLIERVDDRSWEIMQLWSNRLAVLAVFANLTLCAVYAFIVATQSELPITRHWEGFVIHLPDGWVFHIGDLARWSVVGAFSLVALCVAVVMQFGTDFSIPFAAGLASEKSRLIPSILFAVIFPVCIMTTAAMKVDVYNGWGRERIAESTEKQTVSAADQKILDRYANNLPPPQAESNAKIGIYQGEIERLKKLRDETAATRTREENDPSRPGRGPKWDGLDAQVKTLDGQIADQNIKLTEARTALANRIEYDGADGRVKASVRDVTESERPLIYDDYRVVFLRALGMSIISPIFVLASFMIRSARAEAAKRSGAAVKGVATRNANKNTQDADWREGDPIPAGYIEQGELKPGDPIPADTPRRKPQSRKHPDSAGDNSGVPHDPRRDTTVIGPEWLDGETLDEPSKENGDV